MTLTFARWPLVSVPVTDSSVVAGFVFKLQPANETHVAEFELAADRWVALPTLALKSGFLQMLSDIRSDRRLLLLYDSEGRITATRELSLPLGLTASNPAKHLLFGVRTMAGDEFIAYRWRRGNR